MEKLTRLLVANRGEIALRIMRTARRMGIATVAVYSDADERSPHVRFADEAVRIGPPPSLESYLNIGRLMAAAEISGADALHPGYGFLSERAELAEACANAGLIFVGPTPKAIRAMGLKREAKRIARDAGVPVVPGYEGDEQSEEHLIVEAKKIGFPILIKASAGGGGKGMRIVREANDFSAAIASARRESESAFGDGTLLLERYVDRPRHVEIQILGDAHGNLVHLFERECSIQRRHQKIIEETPSTALDPALRGKMGAAAVAVGKAIGYRNAGTVEFIVDPAGQFYFLEVNTRLQVEHPVTEAVTGIDLVSAQIRVARGEPLGFLQADLRQTGAAIECRLYAEDPAKDFLPQSGTLEDFYIPQQEGLRVDAGVEQGSEVSIHYDPLLAKVVTWGGTRGEAIQRMLRALEAISVQGINTNRAFLIRLLAHPDFSAGRIDTHFIERAFGKTLDEPPQPQAVRDGAIAATIAAALDRASRREVLPHVPPGWRNNRFQDEKTEWGVEGTGDVSISYRSMSNDRFEIQFGAEPKRELIVASWKDRELTFELEGHRRKVRVVSGDNDNDRTFAQSRHGSIALREKPRFPERAVEHERGACVAPMPGKVVLVAVAAGQAVKKGATLAVLEAMKMEHAVVAPEDGIIKEVRAAPGDQVGGGAVLIVLEAS